MQSSVRRLFLLLLAVVLGPAYAYAQTAPVAADDAYGVLQDDSLAVPAPGVLDNDTDAERAVLVTPPAHGTLDFGADGGFRYRPEAGFSGTDAFTYRAEAEDRSPLDFTIVQDESELQFKATLRNEIVGSDSDSASSAVRGDLEILLTPGTAPFTEVQLAGATLILADSMDLHFELSGLLTIDAHADPDSVQLILAEPTVPAPVVAGAFVQTDNRIGVRGVVTLRGGGLLGGLVPTDPQRIDVDTLVTLEGSFGQVEETITVTMPIHFEGTVDLGSDIFVDVVISGTVVATAPVAGPLQSEPATVTITVDPTGVGIAEGPEQPAAYVLEQNYPNPFNPATTIAFSLPAPGRVTLEVFDVLGRRRAVLVDAVKQAGRHEVRLDAGHLPGGAYVYRLRAGAFVATRILTLLK